MVSTHEQHARQFQREWTPPMKNEVPTTHEQTAERFTEQFHTDPTVAAIADILTTTSESKRQAVKDALAGDTK